MDFYRCCVFQNSLLLNFRVRSRVFEKPSKFYLSSTFFIFFLLKHGKFTLFLQSFQIQKEHRYGKAKTNRCVPANIYFWSFCSLLPPLFHKHSGCFVNSLFDVAENKKNPNKQLRFLTTISSDVSRKIARKIMEIVEGRGE